MGFFGPSGQLAVPRAANKRNIQLLLLEVTFGVGGEYGFQNKICCARSADFAVAKSSPPAPRGRPLSVVASNAATVPTYYVRSTKQLVLQPPPLRHDHRQN